MGSEQDSRHYTSGMLAGIPVIAGTRVPLLTLVEYLEDGRGLAGFLADYPQVSAHQADRALVLGLRALIDRRDGVLRLSRDDLQSGGSPGSGSGHESP